MSSPNAASTSVANINNTCAPTIPTTSSKHLALITLGPTYDEQIILENCCHISSMILFAANQTACLATAVCDVQSCSVDDPAYVCISRLRDKWKVEGEFKCEMAASQCDKGADSCEEAQEGIEDADDWVDIDGSVKVSGSKKQLKAEATRRTLWAVVAITVLAEVLSWVGGG